MLRQFMLLDVAIFDDRPGWTYESDEDKRRSYAHGLVRAGKIKDITGLIIRLVQNGYMNGYLGAKSAQVKVSVETIYRPFRKPVHEPVMKDVMVWRVLIPPGLMVGNDCEVYRNGERISLGDLDDLELNRLLEWLPQITEHYFGT